jgi:DNA-binding beta-propeller fold protein YncE
VFTRDLSFSATFSGIGVYDPESIINAFAVYDDISFSVAGQDPAPNGIAFNNDGSKMYMVGNTNNSVYEYDLSTEFDLSTASYDSVSFSVASQDTSPLGIAFNNDGSKLYIVGAANDSVYQYTLSTPFDLSTASYDSVSFSVTGQDTTPLGIAFNNDGSKMYMVGDTTDSVYQYTLSTPFNLATASYDNVSFDVAGQDTSPSGIAFNSDGSKMYILGYSNDTVFQYTLSTPFDLSTASYDSVSFDVGGQDATPYGIAFNNDGSKLYMVGYSNDSVYQYSASPPSFSTVHVLGDYKTLTTEYTI